MKRQATRQYRHFYFDRFAPFNHENPEQLSSKIPAGVYISSTERDRHDVVEDGFRLLLPYTLAGGHGNPRATLSEKQAGGARTSDGSFIHAGSMEDLFQHAGINRWEGTRTGLSVSSGCWTTGGGWSPMGCGMLVSTGSRAVSKSFGTRIRRGTGGTM